MKINLFLVLRSLGSFLCGCAAGYLVWLIWHFSIPSMINWSSTDFVYKSLSIFIPVAIVAFPFSWLVAKLIRTELLPKIMYAVPLVLLSLDSMFFELIPFAREVITYGSFFRWLNVLLIGFQIVAACGMMIGFSNNFYNEDM